MQNAALESQMHTSIGLRDKAPAHGSTHGQATLPRGETRCAGEGVNDNHNEPLYQTDMYLGRATGLMVLARMI
jgi:hypothetical protein